MHSNMRQHLGFDRKLEGRRSSLDAPRERMPSWLEDMSRNTEQSHSLIMDGRYKRQYAESNNNEQFKLFPSDQTLNSGQSTDSTPSTAVRFGRRASSSLSTPNRNQYISVDMNAYLVPKIQLNFEKNAQPNYDLTGFKPVYKTSSNLNPEKDTASSRSNLESYSPSMLEQNTGRRSRLDVLDDQIVAKMNDLPISEAAASKSPEPFVTKAEKPSVPVMDSTISKRKELLKSTMLDEPSGMRLNIDHEVMLLRNKIQKYKKLKYNKTKHKQIIPSKEIEASETSTPCGEIEDRPQSRVVTAPEELFIIPEKPKGSVMVLDILSTWGDRYYVGLNGIELFNSDGNIVHIKKISACPEDVNVLPECNGDPRVVSNLVDGVNRTQDDLHVWLTPFEFGQHHLVTIEFFEKTELAMIRIWNYNKSRIHSYRGAKDVVITLDEVCIFKGEIAQASGSMLGGIESFGDTILFTVDETILEKIAVNDISYTTLISVIDRRSPERLQRPPTASAHEEVHQRPFTHACTKEPVSELGEQLFSVQKLDLVLVLNWGRTDYIGFTGLEVIGDSDISITIPKEAIRSNNLATGAMLGRLLDDENITVDRKHMWYTQYMPGEEITISIFFDKSTYIAGIRVWNYNENLEMSFSGVRLLKIYLDNKAMMNALTNDATFLLRRAPGNTHYDFVQEIRFCQPNIVATQDQPLYDLNSFSISKEELYDSPILPEGFVFQIVIYTTWGDQYYVGLNGLEIFDQNGKKIMLTESNICAHPESVNVLPGVSGDIRTPDKLVDGINDRSDGTHSWLVPIIPKCLNRIYIVFDHPVTISVMRVWNYLKTPARGVKEFGILVDDLLIYNGILDKISEKSSVKYRTILFTNNKNVLQKEMASLVKHSIDSQGTVLVDNEQRMTTGGSLPNADQSLRPFTSVSHLSRRTTQSN